MAACFPRILILAMMMCLVAVTTHSAKSGGGSTGTGRILALDFDGVQEGQPFLRKSAGAALVPGGHTGKALRLPGREYAEIAVSSELVANRGTISFRIKPLWRKGDIASHTFLSMRWADGRDSYLAISRGWWEPTGTGKLYFILSNQEIMHCSLPYEFETGSWTHVTVTWQGGRDGYCRLFLDGEKVAEHRAAFSGLYGAKGPLYLGSDRGGTDSRSRAADFLLDDLIVEEHPLEEVEVLQAYERSEQRPGEAQRKKRRWLDELLQKGSDPHVAKSKQGVVLERRVMFDEDIRWALSRSATDEIVSRLADSGFNVYVPCVWHGRGAYYPASRGHRDPRVAARLATGDDPLAYLLKRAHAAGIEVHPWFTVMRREDSSHPEFYNAATPEHAYDVHNSEFQKFIMELMLEVVQRYPVDGINLDYIRTMGDCSCPDCVSGYRRRSGRDLLEDLERKRRKKERVQSLEEWHGAAVSGIVREFSRRARLLRPRLVISVDAQPLNPALLAQGQDSIAWEKNGWVDAVFVMDYRESIDVKTLTQVRAALRNPAAMVTLLSTYDMRDQDLVPRYERASVSGFIGARAVVARAPDFLADCVRLSRRLWPGSGVAFYHDKRMTDEQGRAFGSGVFAERATPGWFSTSLPGPAAR